MDIYDQDWCTGIHFERPKLFFMRRNNMLHFSSSNEYQHTIYIIPLMVILSTNVDRLLLSLLIGGYIIISHCYKVIENPSILTRGSRGPKRGFTETLERRGVVCRGSSDSINDNLDKQKRLKVLCLHGYLSNSNLFELQLRRLVDETESTTDFGTTLEQI
jgi:hypothetical protein